MFTDVRLHEHVLAALESDRLLGESGQLAGIHLYEPGADAVFHPWASIQVEARKAAGFLRSKGVARGTPVVIALETGIDFIRLFLGTMMAGGIPIPMAPPIIFGDFNNFFRRSDRIYERLGRAAHWIGEASTHEAMARQVPAERRPPPHHAYSVDTFRAAWPALRPVEEAKPHNIAMLQFTSGSTGDPRGVTLTHMNLLSNLEAIRRGLRTGRDDVVVSWLPLYHDMGLIGGLLYPLVNNLPLVLLSPIDFIMDPARWLRVMERHRGTITTAPNFAYEFTCRRLRRADLGDLDLSFWRVAMTGAEHVRPETMRRFAERFRAHGFSKHAFLPVYGLAEATLAVTFSDVQRPVSVMTVSRRRLLVEGAARRWKPEYGDADAWELVSVGRPLHETDVRIVDERDEPVALRRIGEIQVRGPGLMNGYFADPEASAAALTDDGWLRTGDLGFLSAMPGDVRPHLFVVDRIKDLIVKRGRNLYASDLERLGFEVPGVKAGVVAFGAVLPESADEVLVLVAEAADASLADPAETGRITAAISQSVSEATGVRPDHVLLVPRQTLPRTTSGKVQRAESRRRWLLGELR